MLCFLFLPIYQTDRERNGNIFGGTYVDRQQAALLKHALTDQDIEGFSWMETLSKD